VITSECVDFDHISCYGGIANSAYLRSNGKAYLVGHTESADFDVIPCAYQTQKIFLLMFCYQTNPIVSDLVYSTYLKGEGEENGKGYNSGCSGQRPYGRCNYFC
jgi:hypothetical protein